MDLELGPGIQLVLLALTHQSLHVLLQAGRNTIDDLLGFAGHTRLHHLLNRVVQLFTGLIRVPLLKLVEVVLVLCLVQSLHDSEAITIAPRLHSHSRVASLQLGSVVFKRLAKSLIEVVLLLKEPLWVVEHQDGIHAIVEVSLQLTLLLSSWHLIALFFYPLGKALLRLLFGPDASHDLLATGFLTYFLRKLDHLSLVQEITVKCVLYPLQFHVVARVFTSDDFVLSRGESFAHQAAEELALVQGLLHVALSLSLARHLRNVLVHFVGDFVEGVDALSLLAHVLLEARHFRLEEVFIQGEDLGVRGLLDLVGGTLADLLLVLLIDIVIVLVVNEGFKGVTAMRSLGNLGWRWVAGLSLGKPFATVALFSVLHVGLVFNQVFKIGIGHSKVLSSVLESL